jgi:hypothetical protein
MQTNRIELTLTRPNLILTGFLSFGAFAILRAIFTLINSDATPKEKETGLQFFLVIGTIFFIIYIFHLVKVLNNLMIMEKENDKLKIKFRFKRYVINQTDISSVVIANNTFNPSFKSKFLNDYQFLVQSNTSHIIGRDFGLILIINRKAKRRLKFKYIESYELVEIENFLDKNIPTPTEN